jgi:histidine triad (HIT) family protein
MLHNSCLFCKIANKEIEIELVAENGGVIAIKDINPKAPVHYLIIPKQHMCSMADFPSSGSLAAEMFEMVKKLAEKLEEPKAFNIVSNNGAPAGQVVMHLHWHFLSGKNIYEEGGFSL